MDKAEIEGLRPRPRIQQLKTALQELALRPNSGSLLKDIYCLLALAFIQNTILPTLPWLSTNIDLITPWLVITAVRQYAPQVSILTFLAALSLEFRSTVPAGLYIVSYWIAVNVIIQIRSALSWRHQVPWFVCYLLVSIWVHSFEIFIIIMSGNLKAISLEFGLQQFLRIASSIAFGMVLCQKWLKFDADEPVPQ